jgi:hypothetical protein
MCFGQFAHFDEGGSLLDLAQPGPFRQPAAARASFQIGGRAREQLNTLPQAIDGEPTALRPDEDPAGYPVRSCAGDAGCPQRVRIVAQRDQGRRELVRVERGVGSSRSPPEPAVRAGEMAILVRWIFQAAR